MIGLHLVTEVKTVPPSLNLLSYEVKSWGHLRGAENIPVPRVQARTDYIGRRVEANNSFSEEGVGNTST